MDGKTVVITGATSGIGEAAAVALAGMGARIVFLARSAARAQALKDRLVRANPDAAHEGVIGELASLAGMRAAAATLGAKAPRIDILANNAGAIFDHRETTVDGLEKTFALNHMAYFVITEALRPNLDPAGGRIIATSSVVHTMGHADDPQTQGRYSAMRAYGTSKLCNILWTRALARRLDGSGVTANCFHPGAVGTGFGHNTAGPIRLMFRLVSPFSLTPEQGADTLVWLASSPQVEGKSGGYYVRRRLTQPSAAARDAAAAEALWVESERIAGSAVAAA